MKKLFLSVFLLIASAFVQAKTHIDTVVELNNVTYREAFDYEGIADAFRRFTYETGIVIESDILKETEEGIVTEIKIFKASDKNYQGPTSNMELIANPVVKVDWNKVGRVEFGEKIGDEITSRLLVEISATRA